MSFYGDAFFEDELVRRELCRFHFHYPFGVSIPPSPQTLAEKYPQNCDFQRLVDILNSVLVACKTDFPTLSNLQSTKNAWEKSFSCAHTHDGFQWRTKIEYGRLAGERGQVYVNVRMPNDGFVYLPAQNAPFADLFVGPLLTRHRDIRGWNSLNTSTLPSDLEPFVLYFVNWFCGRVHNSLDPSSTNLPTCTVQAWYNDFANRMDVELSTETNGEKCTWSLSFEPWSPVINSNSPGVFDATSLIGFYAAQEKKNKKK